jgi:hypothetical protein
MWAAKAAKMGIRWKIEDGKKVKFCEDNWLGTSSLAIQFWELYVILNEKNNTVCELWDGTNLKCTFRRIVHSDLSRMLTVDYRIQVRLDLQADKSSAVVKGPFFP